MAKRELILHVGMSKTGTTSLQALLGLRRKVLEAQGIYYPRSPGRNNHLLLPCSAVSGENWHATMHPSVWEGQSPQTRIQRFQQEWHEEMRSLPSDIRRVVISSEYCTTMLRTRESIERLAALLRPYFSPISVVVYLRRQDEHAASVYSQRMRVGTPGKPMLPAGGPEELTLYDYATMLENWAAVFGEESLHPRIYERSVLLNGDVVDDFLDLADIELPAHPRDAEIRRSNVSMDFMGQQLMWRAAQHFTEAKGREWLNSIAWRRFGDAVTNSSIGKGWRPSRTEARNFVDRFAASNEAVRRRYFPERKSLFSDDFSACPETDNDLMNVPELFTAALEVLLRVSEQGAEREANQLVARAKLHSRLEEPEASREALLRAVTLDPQNAAARVLLGEHYLSSGDRALAHEHAMTAHEINPKQPGIARLLAKLDHPEEGRRPGARQQDNRGRRGRQEYTWESLLPE